MRVPCRTLLPTSRVPLPLFSPEFGGRGEPLFGEVASGEQVAAAARYAVISELVLRDYAPEFLDEIIPVDCIREPVDHYDTKIRLGTALEMAGLKSRTARFASPSS